MSVYTVVSQPELEAFLAGFTVGSLEHYEGIRAGVVNTNYFVTTSDGEFVLTLFETMTAEELPYFLELMAYLADQGLPSAHPVAGGNGHYLHRLNDRPAALVQRLQGNSLDHPSPDACAEMGRHMGFMHRVGDGFPQRRPNPLGPAWWREVADQLQGVIPGEDWELLNDEASYQLNVARDQLPVGVVHADLFRDNALFRGDRLSGVIDFYYACDDALLFDLAVATNDWCLTPAGDLATDQARAFISAYHAERPLADAELERWSDFQRAASLRFWVSRLLDKHFPRDGHLTHIKDPDHFRDQLLHHREQSSTTIPTEWL